MNTLQTNRLSLHVGFWGNNNKSFHSPIPTATKWKKRVINSIIRCNKRFSYLLLMKSEHSSTIRISNFKWNNFLNYFSSFCTNTEKRKYIFQVPYFIHLMIFWFHYDLQYVQFKIARTVQNLQIMTDIVSMGNAKASVNSHLFELKFLRILLNTFESIPIKSCVYNWKHIKTNWKFFKEKIAIIKWTQVYLSISILLIFHCLYG